MDTRKLRVENFSDIIRSWSLEKFNESFSGVYPEVELLRITNELGLKSEIQLQAKPKKTREKPDYTDPDLGDEMKDDVAINE